MKKFLLLFSVMMSVWVAQVSFASEDSFANPDKEFSFSVSDRGLNNDNGQYDWVFDSIDRNNGCQRCQYTCGSSCSRRNEGSLMGCYREGSRDDTTVYVCRRR